MASSCWPSPPRPRPGAPEPSGAVSRANGCPYCTAAFCTILNYGLGKDENYVRRFVTEGSTATEDERTATIVQFAEKVNADPAAIDDGDVDGLRKIGLTDKGVVQLVHLVRDFGAYNRLNIALGRDYDYRDMWREVAFDWQPGAGDWPGWRSCAVRGVAPRWPLPSR